MEFAELKKKESPVVTTLGRLVARLALDEELYRAFCDDADAVIAGAGLSPEEEAALKAGDWQRIKAHLGPKSKPIQESRGEEGGGSGGGG